MASRSFFVNLHHLRVGMGLSAFPFNPNAHIALGSAEYSMQRCLESVHTLHEVGRFLSAPCSAWAFR